MANELSNFFHRPNTETSSPGLHDLMSRFSPIASAIGLPMVIHSSDSVFGTNDSVSGTSDSQGSHSQHLESSYQPASVQRLDKSVSTAPTDLESLESTTQLSPEFKNTINNSSKVIIRMPPCDTTRSDIVIKTDGTIVHYLSLDPEKNSGNLEVSLEKGDSASSGLTVDQVETLKDLFSYAKNKNKEFTVELSDSLRDETERAERKYQTRRSSSNNNESGRAFPGSQPFLPDSPLTNGTMPNFAPRAGARSSSDDSCTTEGISYRPSINTDWTQVNLFDLLLDWFNSDPETFKKLLPGLHKKVVGAHGKLDLTKLRKLVDSKNPMIGDLKIQLPRLAEAFPTTKHQSSDKVSASDSAVNKTGAVLADKAAKVSEELGTSGYCAKGVSFAIERATGKIIWGNANDMRESLPEQGFTVSKSKDLKVGQVVHVYWTPEVYAQEQARRGPCPNYGDIAIIGKGRDGQLYAYNDAATPLNNYLQKSRYDWSTLKVFNPPSV